jgi:hypothetical protein
MSQKLPSQLEEAELQRLTAKLRAGEATAKDVEQLAFGHIRLAFYYASQYAAKQNNMADVFESDALFGLAMALTRAPEKLTHDDLTRYIVTWMRKYLFKTLTEDRVVRIPYTTLKDREKKGLSTHIPKVVKVNGIPSKNANSLYELKDVIQSCIRDAFEQEVIALRELGFTDAEIAAKLQCSRSSVTTAKGDVYKRFLDAMQELN